MGRYHHHHWQGHHHGHWGRRGFNPLGLIVPIVLLFVFGGFIFKALLWVLPFLLIAWGVSKITGWSFASCPSKFGNFNKYDDGDDYRSDKLKNDYTDDKPKRDYVQTSDGQWVEII